MKKLIILIVLSFFCFGCEARYQLTINEDLSVEEEIVGLETESFYENYPKSTKARVIDFITEKKDEYLNEVGYSKKIVVEEDLTGAIASKKFSSLEEYFEQSKAYTQFYENWEHSIENGVVTLKMQDQLLRNENSIERYVIDNCTVSITLPFKVKKSNADNVDKKSNTYTWDLDDQSAKDIYIKFDSKNKYVYKENNYIKYIFLVIGLIAIISIVYIIYNKNKQNNKI